MDDLPHDAIETMTEHRFRHLPVMEDGELVGIVSIGDILKHLLEEAEQLGESLLGPKIGWV